MEWIGGNRMSGIVRVLGAVVFSAAMYAVPILTVCSYYFGWGGWVLPLTIVALLQFVFVVLDVIERAEE